MVKFFKITISDFHPLTFFVHFLINCHHCYFLLFYVHFLIELCINLSHNQFLCTTDIVQLLLIVLSSPFCYFRICFLLEILLHFFYYILSIVIEFPFTMILYMGKYITFSWTWIKNFDGISTIIPFCFVCVCLCIWLL